VALCRFLNHQKSAEKVTLQAPVWLPPLTPSTNFLLRDGYDYILVVVTLWEDLIYTGETASMPFRAPGRI